MAVTRPRTFGQSLAPIFCLIAPDESLETLEGLGVCGAGTSSDLRRDAADI